MDTRQQLQLAGASPVATASARRGGSSSHLCRRRVLGWQRSNDPDKTYAKALGVLHPTGVFAQRWTYVIDDQGVIREIDKSVKVANHGKDVASKLERLARVAVG